MPGLDGHAPRGVDPAAERGEDHQPPVAQLVPEALDDDAAVRGEGAGGGALVLDVGEEVLGREMVQVVLAPQALGRPRPSLRTLRQVRLDAAHERPDQPPQLHGPPDGVTVPERELAGDAGRGRDRDPVGRDVRDTPGGGPQHHHVAVHARAQLVDHLLVQLADPSARGARLALEEDRVQAAVRDRAAARDRDDARVPPRLDRVGQPVPRDPRLELRELVGRIGAGEHAEDALEGLPREGLEGGRAADDVEQLVHREALVERHRHELLGEDVERVPRQRRRFDRAVVHALDDDGGLEEVPAVLGEDDALAGLAHVVPGTPDPLEAAGDGGGALHLDDEVHGAHVDAELERAGGDERREAAGLELLLDLETLLPRDAPVVGSHQFLARQLVEALGQALRETAAVGEDDGAVVLPDQGEDPGVDGWPDAGAAVAADDRAAGLLVLREHLAQPGHVLHGHDHLQLQGLAGAGVHDGDVPPLPGAAQEAGDGLEWALGGGEADALERRRRRRAEALQALQAQGEVRAALRAGDGMDLVHDHVLDATQDLARLAGQQEVEALGRGDEDVRRALHEAAALVGRGVAGPRPDRDARSLITQALGGQRDAGERGPEVALHVVCQGLERADVEHADGAGVLPGGGGTRMPHEAVQAPEERGEGLAAAGRGMDQRVAAGADRRPALRLGLRGRLERRLEPGPHGGPERRERINDWRGHGRASIGRDHDLVQMFSSLEWPGRAAPACGRRLHARRTPFARPHPSLARRRWPATPATPHHQP